MSNDSFKKIDMHRIDMTKIVEQMPQINIVNPLESVMSDHQKNMDSISDKESKIKSFFGKLTGDVAVMMFEEYLKLLYFPAK